MTPRFLAQRLDTAQKRIVAAVETLAQGRDIPPLPEHRDPQQQALYRLEWTADRLDELVAVAAKLAQAVLSAEPSKKKETKQ